MKGRQSSRSSSTRTRTGMGTRTRTDERFLRATGNEVEDGFRLHRNVLNYLARMAFGLRFQPVPYVSVTHTHTIRSVCVWVCA